MIESFLTGKADGYRHKAIDVTGSTNSDCFDAAQLGDIGNLWITANVQEQGKGSRGRGWVSEAGNLYASLLLNDPCAPEYLIGLPFVASLGVSDALIELGANKADVAVKWPNDVLINGKKCSGILLESKVVGRTRYVVIGHGINCKHHPYDTLHDATNLQAEGVNVDVKDLFVILASTMATRISQWDRGTGFSEIRAEWLNRAFGQGKEIEVRIPGNETKRGTFKSIDDRGCLMLEDATGQLSAISTADIFFQNTD